MSNVKNTHEKSSKRHRKVSAGSPKQGPQSEAEITASMADALEDILRHESITIRVA